MLIIKKNILLLTEGVASPTGNYFNKESITWNPDEKIPVFWVFNYELDMFVGFLNDIHREDDKILGSFSMEIDDPNEPFSQYLKQFEVALALRDVTYDDSGAISSARIYAGGFVPVHIKLD